MKIQNCRFGLFMAAFFVVTLIACQKESSPEETAPPKELSSKDPVALSKSMKVWHGVRVEGTPPSPKGNVLQLDASSTEPTKAFAGRYAIIQPEIVSGDVAGYYVALNGAKEYFKVDYTKPREVPGRVGNPARKKVSPFSRTARTQNGNADSSLVIVLPASIKVPDTFCVTYWAYDAAGNVSNPVTNCVIVNSVGPDANGGWIAGNWKMTADWSSFGHDTMIYNRWRPDGDMDYYCHVDTARGFSYLSSIDNGTPIICADSIFYRKFNLTLAANGGQTFNEDESDKHLDQLNSNCSNHIYHPVSNYTYSVTGAWQFNSATNRITLIFEFDDAGLPVVEAWEYDVIKRSNNHFILVDNWDPADPYYMRWEK